MGAIVESGSSLLEDEDFGRDAIGRRFSSQRALRRQRALRPR